jgi:hypothetical protein
MASNPLDVLRRHITNIPSPLYVACWLGAEVASVVPTDVEADDLVASCPHERDQNSANVAAVTGDEHPHSWSPHGVGRQLRPSVGRSRSAKRLNPTGSEEQYTSSAPMVVAMKSICPSKPPDT